MNIEEQTLAERIQAEQNKAHQEGWNLTKKLVGEGRENLLEQIVSTYSQPLNEIDSESTKNHSYTFLRKMELLKISIDTDIFDAYRRAGNIKEALELGKTTLDKAVKIKDDETVLKVGNFLSLAYFRKGYDLIGGEQYDEAIKEFEYALDIFEKLPIDKAEQKNGVMLYTNKAVNFLNIYETAKLGEIEIDYDTYLTKAKESIDSAQKKLEEWDVNNITELSIWKANILHAKARIKKFEGDYQKGINLLKGAYNISKNNSDYNSQIIGLGIELAHMQISRDNPKETDITQAKKLYESLDLTDENLKGINPFYKIKIKALNKAIKE